MCPLRLNSCFLSPGPSGLNKDYLPVDVSLLIGKGRLGENPEARPQLWHLSTSHKYRLSQMPVGSPKSVSCVPPDIQMIRQGQEDTLWASWSYDYVFYPPNTIEIDFNLTLKTSSWQPICVGVPWRKAHDTQKATSAQVGSTGHRICCRCRKQRYFQLNFSHARVKHHVAPARSPRRSIHRIAGFKRLNSHCFEVWNWRRIGMCEINPDCIEHWRLRSL